MKTESSSSITHSPNRAQFKQAKTENNIYGQFDMPRPTDLNRMVSAKELRTQLQAKKMSHQLNSSAKPIKAYSDAWYQNHRPSATINTEKKIVDSRLIEVLNHQATIEQDVRKKFEGLHKPLLTRQSSPQRKSRSQKKKLPLSQSKKLPEDILKAIDSMVSAKMREQFPIKEFKSKKERLIAQQRKIAGLDASKTWSSNNLRRKINGQSEQTLNSKMLGDVPSPVNSVKREIAL